MKKKGFLNLSLPSTCYFICLEDGDYSQEVHTGQVVYGLDNVMYTLVFDGKWKIEDQPEQKVQGMEVYCDLDKKKEYPWMDK